MSIFSTQTTNSAPSPLDLFAQTAAQPSQQGGSFAEELEAAFRREPESREKEIESVDDAPIAANQDVVDDQNPQSNVASEENAGESSTPTAQGDEQQQNAESPDPGTKTNDQDSATTASPDQGDQGDLESQLRLASPYVPTDENPPEVVADEVSSLAEVQRRPNRPQSGNSDATPQRPAQNQPQLGAAEQTDRQTVTAESEATATSSLSSTRQTEPRADQAQQAVRRSTNQAEFATSPANHSNVPDQDLVSQQALGSSAQASVDHEHRALRHSNRPQQATPIVSQGSVGPIDEIARLLTPVTAAEAVDVQVDPTSLAEPATLDRPTTTEPIAPIASTTSRSTNPLGRAGSLRADATSANETLAPADRVRLVNRVTNALARATPTEDSLRIRLSPPELGSLRLEVRVTDGALSAQIEAESTLARNALIENLPDLRERLAEQGIRVESFDVDLRDPTQQQTDKQDAQSRQASRQRTTGSSGNDPIDSNREDENASTTASSNAVINVIV